MVAVHAYKAATKLLRRPLTSYISSPTKLSAGVDGGTALPPVLVEVVLRPPVVKSPGGGVLLVNMPMVSFCRAL